MSATAKDFALPEDIPGETLKKYTDEYGKQASAASPSPPNNKRHAVEGMV